MSGIVAIGGLLLLAGCAKPSDEARKRLEVLTAQRASPEALCAATKALAEAYAEEGDDRLSQTIKLADDRCPGAYEPALKQDARRRKDPALFPPAGNAE